MESEELGTQLQAGLKKEIGSVRAGDLTASRSKHFNSNLYFSNRLQDRVNNFIGPYS